jgi:hypothetical protein
MTVYGRFLSFGHTDYPNVLVWIVASRSVSQLRFIVIELMRV